MSEIPRHTAVTTAQGSGSQRAEGMALPERWRPARLLGRGGQADVWLAEDTELGEMVAVKVFREALSDVGRERLRREVRVGRTLQHPGLVRVYELIEAGERPAVVLELVRGGSVADRLRQGPLPVAEVVVLAMKVLEALDHLHGHRVIHRDLKPSNLLLDGGGGVKVTDFGLIRMLESGRDLTRTATTVGTPTYMSPEQVRGQEPGVASDLYSLGVTLYEMLSGRPPFAGSSEFDLAARHLTEVPTRLRAVQPGCPGWLDRFVMTLLEKRPADRFGSAAQALEVLRAARTPLSRRVRRRLGRLAAGAMLVVLGALAGAAAVAHWRAGTAVRVEARGREVVGLDERGRRAWRVALQQEVFETAEVDLTGDGIPEIVVSAAADARELRRRDGRDLRGELLVVTRKGRVVSQVRPEDLVHQWPFEYPRNLRCSLHHAPRVSFGEELLIARCLHGEFFPAVVAVFRPDARHWAVVLNHEGWFLDLVVVAGHQPPRVVMAGVNNRMGAVPVAALVELPPPASPSREGASGDAPWLGPGIFPVLGRVLWYTALEPHSGYPVAVDPDGEGGFVVRGSHGDGWRLDGFGNPRGGPNEHQDLSARRTDFLSRLANWGPDHDLGQGRGLESAAEEVRAQFHALLEEPIHAALLDLHLGRALARFGQGDRAREVLRSRAGQTRLPEVLLQLAHLEALAGDYRLAKELLAVPGRESGRWFDLLQLNLRLAIEVGDEAGVDMAVARIVGDSHYTEYRSLQPAALRTRANLWWDRLTIADITVQSTGYEPAGAALACLARWRLGATAAGDAAAMAKEAELNPDARLEFEVARAAALLGEGETRKAVSVLTTTIGVLQLRARFDFASAQVLALARAILVRAMLVSGDIPGAVAEARRLRPAMAGDLLPAILLDEVLAGHAAGTPARS